MSSAREHVHLIGIGGTGMAALAGLLHESGCRVTGSDGSLYPPTSVWLRELGVAVFEGFDPAQLEPAPDLVVVGNAVRRGNPELEAVLDRDLPYTSMARLLAERFMAGRHRIVVAGTHGKTTTTAMLALILVQGGLDPGFLIGGVPRDLPRPYRLGTGPFVVEGDEYDTAFFDKGPKFMHYRPRTAVLGTVEFDHADIFRDVEHVRLVFRQFVRLLPQSGLLVRHEDCPTTREVSAEALCAVEGFGLERGLWRAAGLREGAAGVGFSIRRGEDHWGAVALRVPGVYNVRNALAASAVAASLEIPARAVTGALASFTGVRRRLEIRGEADGVTVVDDFAHHPTAVRETLRAVRARFPGRRVWAVLEPRSWSMRRRVFQEALVDALAQADRVIVAPVYRAEEIPERERLDPERLGRDLNARHGVVALHFGSIPAIVQYLAEHAAPGEIVVVMSNGACGGLHDALLAALESRAEARA